MTTNAYAKFGRFGAKIPNLTGESKSFDTHKTKNYKLLIIEKYF